MLLYRTGCELGVGGVEAARRNSRIITLREFASGMSSYSHSFFDRVILELMKKNSQSWNWNRTKRQNFLVQCSARVNFNRGQYKKGVDLEKFSVCCFYKVLFSVALCLLVLINIMVASSARLAHFSTDNEGRREN